MIVIKKGKMLLQGIVYSCRQTVDLAFSQKPMVGSFILSAVSNGASTEMMLYVIPLLGTELVYKLFKTEQLLNLFISIVTKAFFC